MVPDCDDGDVATEEKEHQDTLASYSTTLKDRKGFKFLHGFVLYNVE